VVGDAAGLAPRAIANTNAPTLMFAPKDGRINYSNGRENNPATKKVSDENSTVSRVRVGIRAGFGGRYSSS